ncbi:hypothetical protein HYV81_04900 [Candidatus Woesearchaeota archaeon]|nr:hypothetical protein [Candidatus Woesearchaeota archaeon]
MVNIRNQNEPCLTIERRVLDCEYIVVTNGSPFLALMIERGKPTLIKPEEVPPAAAFVSRVSLSQEALDALYAAQRLKEQDQFHSYHPEVS